MWVPQEMQEASTNRKMYTIHVVSLINDLNTDFLMEFSFVSIKNFLPFCSRLLGNRTNHWGFVIASIFLLMVVKVAFHELLIYCIVTSIWLRDVL